MSIEMQDKKGWKEYKKGQDHLVTHKYELARDCFMSAFDVSAELGAELGCLASFWLHILLSSEYYKIPDAKQAAKFEGVIQTFFKYNENNEFIAKINKHPDGPMILAYLQQKNMIDHNFNYSPQKFYQQPKEEGSDVFFYQFRGEFYLDKKKYINARRDFCIAIDKDKKFIPAFFGYAKCQRHLKNHDSATAHSYFETIVKECPEDHVAWYEWGMLCFYEENYQDALTHFNQALIFDAKNKQYKHMLEMTRLKNTGGFWKVSHSPSQRPLLTVSKFKLESVPLMSDFKHRRLDSITSKKNDLGHDLIEFPEAHHSRGDSDIVFPAPQSHASVSITQVMSRDQRQPSVDSNCLEHQEYKFDFFRDISSSISKKHKITKDSWQLFIACQIDKDLRLDWEGTASLFLEGIHEQYFLERYYLHRDQIHHAKVLVEQLKPAEILFDDIVEGVVQVHSKNQAPVRYYVDLNSSKRIGAPIHSKELKIFLNDLVKKTGYPFPGSKCFGLTETSLNHWAWCNSVIRHKINSNGAPPIEQLPQVIRGNVPSRHHSVCIVC